MSGLIGKKTRDGGTIVDVFTETVTVRMALVDYDGSIDPIPVDEIELAGSEEPTAPPHPEPPPPDPPTSGDEWSEWQPSADDVRLSGESWLPAPHRKSTEEDGDHWLFPYQPFMKANETQYSSKLCRELKCPFPSPVTNGTVTISWDSQIVGLDHFLQSQCKWVRPRCDRGRDPGEDSRFADLQIKQGQFGYRTYNYDPAKLTKSDAANFDRHADFHDFRAAPLGEWFEVRYEVNLDMGRVQWDSGGVTVLIADYYPIAGHPGIDGINFTMNFSTPPSPEQYPNLDPDNPPEFYELMRNLKVVRS